MKRTSKYVAQDVHRAMTVASVREESGRIIALRTADTHDAVTAPVFTHESQSTLTTDEGSNLRGFLMLSEDSGSFESRSAR
jgi:hypothetical protein